MGAAPKIVRSADGTPIAYWPSGSGPPLVLVHGAPGVRHGWDRLLPILGSDVTVCPMDRRGRGASGDSQTYALRREFEDVAAVVQDIGGPVDLFGHSFGGPVALEATLLAPNVRRLILYEPYLAEYGPYPDGMVERFEAMAEAGDAEGVLMIVMKDLGAFTDEEVAEYRAQPTWSDRVEAAGVFGRREARAENDYRFDPERFTKMRVPTLLLEGSESPQYVRAGAEAVNVALPDSRVVVLAGQGHAAHLMAPELLAGEILAFVDGE